MKKTVFKTLASVMAGIMILASVQINAFAATTLTFSENTGINMPYITATIMLLLFFRASMLTKLLQ